MTDFNYKIITLENIFQKCSQRGLRAESSGNSMVISSQAYGESWNAFIKWCKTQLDQDRTITIPNFAIITSQQSMSDDKEKRIYLTLLDSFVSKNGLQYKKDHLEVKYQAVTINFSAIAKLIDLDRNLVHSAITNVFNEATEILANGKNIELDLGHIGKFMIADNQVQFNPFIKSKTSTSLSKQTVQGLIESKKGAKAPDEESMEFNPEGNKYEQSNANIAEKSGSFDKSQIRGDKKSDRVAAKPALANRINNSNMVSPTRRYNKPDEINLLSEMLGAGTNPMAKSQDFSLLASNAKKLINAQFSKPANAKIRFPPILDKFSRTLASPISSQKYNLSVSARIGCNFTPSAKRLYIDTESKCIRVAKETESKVQFTANPELLQKTASLQEELAVVVGGKQDQELINKLKSKRMCYNRYRAYIENEIGIEYVADIRQYWITNILDSLPSDFQFLERSVVSNMIDEMLNEINKDYYDSVRKAILDYVLKDEDEKYRIGIMEVWEKKPDYGDNVYQGIEPDETWKDHINQSRDEISQILVICNMATLRIMRLWKKYETMYFLYLPQKKDQPMTIQYFIKLQEDRVSEVKTLLNTEWLKEVIDIYQEEIGNMRGNKKQVLLFFESNATLMSNQIRGLVSDTLIYYRDFFRRFKSNNLKAPATIVEMEKNPRGGIEDVFLIIKLRDDEVEGNIQFADGLDFVKNELLRIIRDIVETSHNFGRPEYNNNARGDKQMLTKVPLDDQIVNEVAEEIEIILDTNLENITNVLQIYDEYAFLLREMEKVMTFVSTGFPTRVDYEREITKYKNIYNDVNKIIPFFIRMNMVLIDGVEVKQKFLQICDQIVEQLLKSIHAFIMKKNTEITKEIGALIDGISYKADTPERLVEIERNIEKIKTKEHSEIEGTFTDLRQWLFMLYSYQFRPDEELKAINNLADQVHTLISKVEREENRVKKERDELESKIRKVREEFSLNIDNLTTEIESVKAYSGTFQQKEANEKIDRLDKKLADYLIEMQDIREKEELIGWPPSEFPKLLEAKDNLKPFQDLWRLIRDYDSNMTSWTKEKVVFKLNPEQVEKETKQMITTSSKLVFLLKQNLGPLKLATDLQKDLKAFQNQLPLIHVLCNPGLKADDWDQITNIVGGGSAFQIRPNKDITLKKLIDMEAEKYIPRLEEISDDASKRFNLEKALTKMKEDWEPVTCVLKTWKDTGTYVVEGASIEEIQTLLDDHIIKNQTMKGSPYAKEELLQNIIEWEQSLTYTFNMVEYWVKVQQVWLYLEPIFSSPDIIKHLSVEATRFREVDANWRSMMNKINSNPKVLEFTKNKKLLDILKECNQNLDMVQKGLNAYLEGKRTSFARFYFLSNDELLEILSETKDPLRVQPHLKKCFEGIQKLKFDDDKKIYGMYSSEGEYVEFTSIIDTNLAKGQVDEWLLQVEKNMIVAVKEVGEKAYKDFPTMGRDKWVLDRCGMAVLCMNMTYWTYDTEQVFEKGAKEGMPDYSLRCTSLLEEIVALVRKDISKLNRCTIEALIVLDVHNRDVIKNLADQGIEKITDFAWQSQLRYYWTNNDSKVRIINAELHYNYEYLGNSARLVITPLTDRCYRTLCGALHLNYGGAPEGPAGTGKTETVKDLAKALARQCVVFNCSDGLDYKAMSKFFKGLASSGAWSCFDEFNRIDLEVLSVVAQQISTITLARAKKLEKFWFEDAEIRLLPTCNVFITMNPGYAGRSELPDNLKALFRSVAMMVPDYALIAEISLYSFGFSHARNLARKIVTTYKLCSEQLSSQKHYDYGMRAVKSVLTAAGNLKRKFATEDENILMLRAINDVNLAKFLNFDLPLFTGIASDLFPKVELPQIDYAAMYECIDTAMKKRNLTSIPYVLEKIIQLYEMILVRHGLMVVGEPFSGKTSIIHVLADSLTLLKEKGLMGEEKVHLCTLNPKSIHMKQLYGAADEVTNEWTDGVLAVKFRVFAKMENLERKWLIFDGPVDAIWIENMNTVLDDNKKLCLNSGEIIAMAPAMNLIFEPADLLVASPATVSRCGMVYMEPNLLGWQPLFESWKNKLPDCFMDEDYAEINILFNWAVDPILDFMRRNCHEISPTQNTNLVVSLMRIFKSLNKDLADPEYYQSIDVKSRIAIIDNRFVFALMWSLGGSVTTEYRKTFDLYVKKLFGFDIQFPPEVKRKKISLPDRSTLYDWRYEIKPSKDGGEWILWTNSIDLNEVIPPKAQPQDLIIKTVDTVRYSFLLLLNINNEVPTLFCGPTGTGKTVYIQSVLRNSLEKDKYSSIDVGFSAQTTAAQTQEIIESKLDRLRKGIFGPKQGKYIIFVDDLNMPAKESWGAQPPIEILRQLIDQGGFYDNKDKEKPFKNVVECIFVAAMGEPGGGRTFITSRLLRHLNLISLAQFDEDTLNRIFNTILHWYFGSNQFNSDVIKCENKIVSSTLDVYRTALKDLLPTPMKSHYLFNLRDFSKVILGICMSDRDRIQNQEHVIRLWVHEAWRVFGDRLINEEDKMFLLNYVRSVVRNRFGLNFDDVFIHLDKEKNGKKDGKIDTLDEIRGLMFTDIMTPAGIPKRFYEEITDYTKLQVSVEQSLQNYNLISDKPMDLVLFSFAIEHLLVIARILKQPGGNALLVGVGGSGRQSLTRLAAKISDYEVFQIEITKVYGKTEWHEDLKKILKQAGSKFISTVFLFTDSQIKDESFVEDINNLLNSAEVPNLFPPEEKIEVQEAVRPQARQEGKAMDGTPAQLYAYFIEQVKKQLHIVLCFSPIGGAFRERVRMFPSLVNCCTIDWFSEWPQDALVSVAQKFFNPIDMEAATKASCVSLVQYFHESTIRWSKTFWDNLRRKYYVTPTSYLEMIMLFKSLLNEKRKEVNTSKFKYENGYEKIIVTEKKVEEMQKNLIDLQPKLKKAAEDTEIKMKEVAKQAETADSLKQVVEKDKAVIQEAVDEANAIKEDCQRDLDEAMPALMEAEQALSVLDKKDIDLLKTFKAPAAPVKATMQACCLLLYPNPTETKKNQETLKTEIDWWAASMKLLGDMNFLNKMTGYDREKIEEKDILRLGKFIKDPEMEKVLEVKTVENASAACKCIIMWVKGIYNFYFVNKKVKPKRAKLEESEAKVSVLNQQLAEKQRESKIANDNLEALNNDLNITKKNKQRLEAEYEECSKQLERAKKLTENLGGEKGRWAELAKQLAQFYVTLTGDILCSAGMIAYLGAFTSFYRNQITKDWVEKLTTMNIPNSKHFSLREVLGDPVKIRSWNIDGLPSDEFSVENGIIISKSRRWSLCIDPQGQANKWIKKMDSAKGINVIKLTDGDFLRTLENSIQFGQPVLLENVGEELDPALEPILMKQVFQKGSTTYIKLGDQQVEYSPNFMFYITTKYRNPHYLPEISTKVTLINFMITYEGLNDQLLGILVKQERPELAKEKERLIVEGANNKKQLQEIEDKILEVLSGQKNILTDETAIEVLTASKVKSNEIKEKQSIAEKTEKEIDSARSQYRGMSEEASCLFFAISDLANIDPMYQYSLVYYIDLFTQAILKSEQSTVLEERLSNLRTYFLYSLYSNICRSLFEKDKLLFSFLLSTRLMEFRKELETDTYRFLLTGGISLGETLPEKPKETWLSMKSWGEICRLSSYPGCEDLFKSFYEAKSLEIWKKIYDDKAPYKLPLPSPFEENLSAFHRLMVLRTIRPDKIVPAVQEFVSKNLGAEFIQPPAFELPKIYKDSSAVSPLIFVLSPGNDPFQSLQTFSNNMGKEIFAVSLGQGQGPLAKKYIDDGVKKGTWVVLQNCHVFLKWMPKLEQICDTFSPDPKITHPDFRLWLTSYPSPDFPTSILQNGVKMTNEPPKGLKNNLQGSFLTDPISSEEFFEGCQQSQAFKRLLFGLTFFHAVIQERRKYGPLGWNIQYEFNESDLRICVRQLKMFLDEDSTVIPFDALKYLTSECNYGGRVTDDKDRILINTILDDYYNIDMVSNQNYMFVPDKAYLVSESLSNYQDYMNFIRNLPLNTIPEVFGFHANADITKDINETFLLFDSLLLCSSEGGGGGGKSFEETLNGLANTILADFPQPFDLEAAISKYAIIYTESMNTVLTQELNRFNDLIKIIIKSLKELLKALKGEILMSPQLERASKSLFDGKVPELWKNHSYPSLKPLASYITDLKNRIAFFQKWLDKGQPDSFWISGLFFTQSFLTGVMQNFARKYTIPIDELLFEFEVLNTPVQKKPEDGAYVYGLFIEGCKWDPNQNSLAESDPKILFVSCPTILLKPTHHSKINNYPHYNCPVYKTSERRGVLSTTGHSTNFVMFLKLPSNKDWRHWTKRGVALLTQLDD